ncbi:MAG TPA: hypothetical protein VGO43_07725 [Pyrinomonadaceae bacterium]|nr:hypothetical protein [Pyrinomonadaceae bacterium]
MKKLSNIFSIAAILAAVLLGSLFSAAAQQPNSRQVSDAVRSLNSKLDDLEYNLRYQLQSNSAPNSQISVVGDNIRELRDAVLDFENNLDRHRENRDDARRVADSAQRLNDVVSDIAPNRKIESDMKGVRDQVDRLVSGYGVVARWDTADNNSTPDDRTFNQPKGSSNSPAMPPARDSSITVGLSGTYSLDRTRSENIDDIVTGTKLGNEQQQDLRDKLEAPEQIAIDLRGNQVTLATSNAAPVTFTADGRDKVESGANGKTIRLRATLAGDNLIVSSIGGETDYNITFTSLSNGRGLKVSRRITTDYLSQTVFAESVYNKTDGVAQLDIGGGSPIVKDNGNGGTSNTSPTNTNNTSGSNGGYSDNDQSGTISNGGSGTNGNYPNTNRGSGPQPRISATKPGNYIIPNGVTLTGRLENEINTQVSQNNDRFKLTVQSPADYRGAVIEGYVSGVGRSGKVSGQSNLTFNFEKITLRDGTTYDFAGQLNAIHDAYGKEIRVDNEGTARGDNQTKETAKRGALGGGLGALIGAIAGGGKGAAIGAIIGGGAGASTVLVTGKDDVTLLPGSTITVVSSSPINQTYQR